MAARPNILILMADQLTAGVLRCYGGSVARTPHIDALAAGGVVFESFYTNSPLCAPSRFSFLAGQLPSRIGAYDNAAEYPAEIPTFAHYLRAAGYQTASDDRVIVRDQDSGRRRQWHVSCAQRHLRQPDRS